MSDATLSSFANSLKIYRNKNNYYICSFRENRSKFRYLTISRLVPDNLQITDSESWFEADTFQSFIISQKIDHNFTLEAYALLGFVIFTDCYYILLATEAQLCAKFGDHSIFSVKNYVLISLCPRPLQTQQEIAYIRLFDGFNLASGFYFSYTYDITNTLQNNYVYGFTLDRPNLAYCWSAHFTEAVPKHISSFWFVPLIHGDVLQADLQLFGHKISLTIIGRKSAKCAGPRFYKRGLTFDGFVANEVETEQIVVDNNLKAKVDMLMSSYVQLRGSFPLFWSHFSNNTQLKAVKPPAIINMVDPYHRSAALHFKRVMARYGYPVVCFNLVKQNEGAEKERVLTQKFVDCLNYLNGFLPRKYQVEYYEFDMSAQRKKHADLSHTRKLEALISELLDRTDLFCTNQSMQNGIVRANCVDCLDRTNVAQYMLGSQALGCQLFRLGVTQHKKLTDEKVLRILRNLYSSHGDTLSAQNTGSQMAHRIEAYLEPRNPISHHSFDMYQTLSRFYQNKFQDFEKQQATNLFLGVYFPSKCREDIKDIFNDFILHNPPKMRQQIMMRSNIRNWWLPIKLPELATTGTKKPSVSERNDIEKHTYSIKDMNEITRTIAESCPTLIKKYTIIDIETENTDPDMSMHLSNSDSKTQLVSSQPEYLPSQRAMELIKILEDRSNIEVYEKYLGLTICHKERFCCEGDPTYKFYSAYLDITNLKQ